MSDYYLPTTPMAALLDKDSVWHGLLNVIDIETGQIVNGVTEVDIKNRWVKVSDRSLQPPRIIYDEMPKIIMLRGDYRLEWTDKAKDIFDKITEESAKSNNLFRYLTPSLVIRMRDKAKCYGIDYGETTKDFLAFYGLLQE